MECLNDRNARTKTGAMNRWRKARKKIVHVYEVRSKAANAFAHFPRVLERIDTLKACHERIHPAHNRIVVLFPNLDLVAHPQQQTTFRLYNRVFSARLLVSVVNKEDSHLARA